jgi:predicted nucleic acid-binding protein
MRAFLDANVLFSASNAGSNIARLIAVLCVRGTAVSSDLAVEEARRNITLKRAAWLPAFDRLLHSVEVVPSALFELPARVPPKDAPLLCAAIRSRSQLFVTGDRRDFGHLMGQQVLGVEIVSPLRLALILAEKRGPAE